MKNLMLLFRHLTIRTIEKGEILLPEGATKKEVFFIRNGLIRSYYINESGEEITFQLFPEYQVLGNVHAIVFEEPSKFNYQALERTKAYAIDYDSFHDLTSENPKLLELNRTYLSKIIIKQVFQRIESFVFLSPEERFEKYIKDNPNVFNRAPDKHIANVLGITPVSLSRIKGRIAAKK